VSESQNQPFQMDRGLQHIRHPSQLSAVSLWRMIWRRTPPRVLIEAEGAGASAARVRAWESQLSRLQSACGCEQGATGLIAGLGVYLLFLLLRSGGWGHPGRREFWIGLGVITSTTSVGKLLGLLLAQRRLKRLIKEIQTHWKPQPLQDQGSGDAGMRWTGPRAGSTRCCGGRSAAFPGA
jgi:hypothetical protein